MIESSDFRRFPFLFECCSVSVGVGEQSSDAGDDVTLSSDTETGNK